VSARGRIRSLTVIWRDPHPLSVNAAVVIAYLHHRGMLQPLGKPLDDEDGDLTMNRFQLSDMTNLPPSVVLSDEPEELSASARPIYEFYETLSSRSQKDLTYQAIVANKPIVFDDPNAVGSAAACGFQIECESEFFPSTARDVMDSAPLKKVLGKSLARFAR